MEIEQEMGQTVLFSPRSILITLKPEDKIKVHRRKKKNNPASDMQRSVRIASVQEAG